MKTLTGEQILSNLNEALMLHEGRINKEIAELEAKREENRKNYAKSVSVVAGIEKALRKNHLLIHSVTGGVTGHGSLQITAVSDGKFRFIKDRGYNASGGSKNHSTLRAKGLKLQGSIKETAKVKTVSVNEYSLEKRGDDKKNIVLISIWV